MVKDVLIGRTLKGITDQEDFSLEKWPSPDLGTLAKKDLERFLKRKEALTLYLQGAAHDAIYASTAIQARFLNRMIRERCMHIHPDGRIYGWRALIPNVRIAKYQRHNKVNANLQGSGTAGALATLLQNEPAFEQMLRKQIIQTCSDLKLGEIRQPRHALWAWFLKELRRLGYETRNEWPFTVKSMGYMSLCRYADAGLNANPIKAARIVGGPQLEKKMVSGDGIHRPVDNPYDRVEMDAHKLDARFVVLIPQLDGGWSPRLIHRLWVIVLLDVASRTDLIDEVLMLVRSVPEDGAHRADYPRRHRRPGAPALARSRLGWEPTIPLREGLANTIQWFRSIDLGHYRPPTPNY